MIAIYARVSTEEQAKHGFSLMDQLRECRKKGGTNDVLEYVDEGVSGEFLDRPALTKLRQDIRDGLIHKVICLDPDRLSRKLMNQLILSDEIEARAELVFVNGDYARTPEGQLFYQMRGAISQFEKAKINERMSRGRREKARQGRVLRDFHIYGYDFDPETEQFVVNEREATIVRLVFELFTNPQGRVKGINGIAKYLTELGVPTKRGAKVFHRQVVRQMLMNRAYIGEFYQNKWNTEGMLGNKFRPKEDRIPQRERPKEEWIRVPIPAIIEKDQFDFVQALLSESRRRWAGTSKRNYLLSGLLRCGECGNTMTGRKQRNWGKDVFVYSDQKNTMGAKNPGCGTKVRCDELEKEVWTTIVSWIRAPDDEIMLDVGQKPSVSLEQSQLERIDKELERLKTITSRILNLLSDPSIDEQDIREKLKQVQQQKIHLQNQRQELQDKINEPEARDNEYKRNLLHEAWERIGLTTFEDIPDRAKQELIRCVVKEIRVYDGGSNVEILTL
jgi:site-specific DNA recombinase